MKRLITATVLVVCMITIVIGINILLNSNSIVVGSKSNANSVFVNNSNSAEIKPVTLVEIQPSTKKIIDGISKVPASPDLSPSIPILEYHYIKTYTGDNKLEYELSVTPENFVSQMEYLKDNGYTTMDIPSLLYFYDKKFQIPQKTVVMTFDDGNISNYSLAFNILKDFNFHAEYYIITGFAGTNNSWMNWDQIKEVIDSGVITIGSHTVNHKDLSILTKDEIYYELKDSKDTLEQKLGFAITDFCYPFGSQNSTVSEVLQLTGYKDAVIGVPSGFWMPNDNIYLMKRQYITGNTTFNEFKDMLGNQ